MMNENVFYVGITLFIYNNVVFIIRKAPLFKI